MIFYVCVILVKPRLFFYLQNHFIYLENLNINLIICLFSRNSKDPTLILSENVILALSLLG